MKRFVTALCSLTVIGAALRWTHSTSGFLLVGLGTVLLLDRYAFRLLPWSKPIARKREWFVLSGCFAFGTVGFYLARLGAVPVREAVIRGTLFSLAVVLLECSVGAITRIVRLRNGRSRIWVRISLLALAVPMVPVVAALHPIHTVPERTPAAFGLEFEDVTFTTADGLRLGGWLVPHPEARGNVIFCHGHGRNRGHVAGLLSTLHELRLNVLAFDFRGHGRSEGHTCTFGHREVQDLLAAEAYLRGRFPERPLFLVGVSLGAAVALQALPHLPHVRGVWSEGSFGRLGFVVEDYFACLPTWLRQPLVFLENCLAWVDGGFWAPAVNPIDALADVRVPIYFCHGRQDRLVPFREARALFTACHKPKRAYWVPGASHYNPRQSNRAEYLRRLRAFLAFRLGKP